MLALSCSNAEIADIGHRHKWVRPRGDAVPTAEGAQLEHVKTRLVPVWSGGSSGPA